MVRLKSIGNLLFSQAGEQKSAPSPREHPLLMPVLRSKVALAGENLVDECTGTE
jgi:hypothetical protein